MNKYHVTYFYLATGMDGIADTKDHGIVEASTKQEAMEIVAQRTLGDEYKDNLSYRYWGLTAKNISPPKKNYLIREKGWKET